MADAFDASSSEAGIFLPCNSPDKKNPVNVSPAAVVSTAFILKAGVEVIERNNKKCRIYAA